jgi:outer membrane protein TolC
MKPDRLVNRVSALLLLALALPASAGAQERGAAAVVAAGDTMRAPVSLEEALERALEESEEVRLARAQLNVAEARTQNAWSAALPQVNTQLAYTKTLRSVFQDAGGGFELPDSLRFEPDPTLSNEERIAYLEDNTPNAAFGALGSLFSDLPFGNENTWIAGLNFQQPLFAGGRIRSLIQAAEHAEDAAAAQYDESAADVVLQVREAYYAAALASAAAQIVEASLELARGHLESVRLQEDAGLASELELLRAEVEVENLLPQLVQARNLEELAMLDLKRLVNLPADADLELTTPLVPADGDIEPLAEALPPLDEVREELRDRAAVRAAESLRNAAEEQIDIARSAFIPTVMLTANLSRQAFPTQTFTFPGSDDWRDDWTVGLALQWPLFQGMRRAAELNEAEAMAEQASLQLEQLREGVDIQYQQAQGDLERSRAQLGAAQRTVQQALRVYELTEMRFAEGLATQLDVDAARLSLQQARLNEVQAYHDARVARARLERALGTTLVPRP